MLRFGWPWDEDYEANTDLGFLANCVCVCVHARAGLFSTQLSVLLTASCGPNAVFAMVARHCLVHAHSAKVYCIPAQSSAPYGRTPGSLQSHPCHRPPQSGGGINTRLTLWPGHSPCGLSIPVDLQVHPFLTRSQDSRLSRAGLR